MFESLFTPPPAEAKQKLEAKKAKLEAKRDMQSAFADMLAYAMLESDMPEHKKVCIRILMKAKKVSHQINEIVDTYAKQFEDEETVKTLYPVREEMCNFLERLENLINEFTTLHPLPVDTQD